jgi:hypothetical protein
MPIPSTRCARSAAEQAGLTSGVRRHRLPAGAAGARRTWAGSGRHAVVPGGGYLLRLAQYARGTLERRMGGVRALRHLHSAARVSGARACRAPDSAARVGDDRSARGRCRRRSPCREIRERRRQGRRAEARGLAGRAALGGVLLGVAFAGQCSAACRARALLGCRVRWAMFCRASQPLGGVLLGRRLRWAMFSCVSRPLGGALPGVAAARLCSASSHVLPGGRCARPAALAGSAE